MYTCLVIEDEKIIRKWIRYGFDYSKYNCVVIGEAADGLEGIEKIKEFQPDIVITDITMPIKTAFDMLSETADQIYSTIIISGYADFTNAQQAIKHGAVEFIVKPIDEKQLGAALLKAIEHVDAQKTLHKSQKKTISLLTSFENKIESRSKDALVIEMIKYIEVNYAEKFIFDDVATQLGYSASTLYQRFKKGTNLTFNDYLNHYRIQKSIEFMTEGYFRLYEIPDKIGFSDYKYFSKTFKRHTSLSPKEFIDLHL